MKAVKLLSGYLKGTYTFGLLLQLYWKSIELQTSFYTQTFLGRWIARLGSGLLVIYYRFTFPRQNWCQDCVSISSIRAKYTSLCKVALELKWILTYLVPLGSPMYYSIDLNCGNTAVNALANIVKSMTRASTWTWRTNSSNNLSKWAMLLLIRASRTKSNRIFLPHPLVRKSPPPSKKWSTYEIYRNFSYCLQGVLGAKTCIIQSLIRAPWKNKVINDLIPNQSQIPYCSSKLFE